MSSVDNRIVSMQFDNAQFEKGIRETNRSLGELKEGLNLDRAQRNIRDLSDVASRFDISNMANGVDHISKAFSALGAIGFTVIQSLTRGALDFGKNLISSVLDPLFEGGQKRALNLEQARFQFEGLGMDIEATMASALAAVKGTAYGLDAAAVAAAQFGATGMRAGDEMTAALTGISGVAAMTGTSYESIARIFTTVAGNGRLMGQQLLQLGTRGVNAAAVISKALGKTERDVREMVSAGEISFELFAKIMNESFGEHAKKANETYTGSLANMGAALSRIGASVAGPRLKNMRDIFNSLTPVIDSLAEAFQPLIDLIVDLNKAASEKIVKWLDGINLAGLKLGVTPIVDGIRFALEALGAILSPIRQAFKIMFPAPTMKQIADFAVGFRNFAETLKMGWHEARNLRRTFKGVFAIFLIGWEILSAVGKVIGSLIGKIFGLSQKGGSSLLGFTAVLGDFFVALLDAVRGGEGLAKFFGGIGEVLRVPIDIIAGFVRSIGDALSGFKDIDTTSMNSFVKGVMQNFAPLVSVGTFLGETFRWIARQFKKVADFFAPMVDLVKTTLADLGEGISNAVKTATLGDVAGVAAATALGGLVWAIGNHLKNFWWAIKAFVSNVNGKLGLVEMIRQMKITFGRLTGTLKTMQNSLRAKALLSIALAVGVLTLSVIMLSKVSPGNLAKALAGIASLTAVLVTSMHSISNTATPARVGQMFALSVGMTGLAIALLLVVSAVRLLSGLDWNELAKGLTGVLVIIGALVASMKLMSGFSSSAKGMIPMAAAMVVLAVAIKLMASAVSDLSGLDWNEMAKGLVGVGVILGSLILFTKFAKASKGGAIQAVGILILAAAIKILASALSDFAKLSWEELGRGMAALGALLLALGLFSKFAGTSANMIVAATGMVILSVALKMMARVLKEFASIPWEDLGKGLLGMAGALAIIAIAMQLMPKGMILSSVALVIVAAALLILANVLEQMAGMTWDEVGRGMVVLAGGLAIIALALYAMSGALPGAAALLVASVALIAFATAMKMFGSLSWDEIGRALTVLSAGIAIVAIGALLLIPAAVIFLALGVAVLLLGTGAILVAKALVLFAAGLASVVAVGAAAAGAVGLIILVFISMIPLLAVGIAKGMILFAKTIATGAKEFGDAFVMVFTAVITAIGETAPLLINTIYDILVLLIEKLMDLVPKVVDLAVLLITELVDALVILIPKIVDAGMKILVGFLKGIGDNIGDVGDEAANVITEFIDAIARNIGDITDSAANLLVEFIDGVAEAVETYSWKFNRAGSKLFRAIVEGVANAIEQGGKDLRYAGMRIGWALIKGARNALGMNSPSKEFYAIGNFAIDGLTNSLKANGKHVRRSGEDVGNEALNGLKSSMSKIADAVNSDMDMSPTIRPVLDLTGVKKTAGELDRMLGKPKYAYSGAAAKASSIAAGYEERERQEREVENSPVDKSTHMEFNQYNTSPKSISPAETYRNTKNQLSIARGALET